MLDDPATPATAAAPKALGHTVIPIIKKVQDIFAQLGSSSTINLPQVSVVGRESSGKSSLLEAIVGSEFLPRAADICTHRPLMLQLINSSQREEWEFL